jgi:protease secretion system membrane fusion protein
MSIALLKPPGNAGDITDVEPTALPDTDTRSTIRLGFWVLLVGFGLFLIWAAWAPLDEGVVAPSTVSIEARKNTIQHMQGGVIRKVLVNEGQMVKRGDVLAELDDGATRAGYEAIRQNYLPRARPRAGCWPK